MDADLQDLPNERSGGKLHVTIPKAARTKLPQ
jgi:hypothetical protein